MRRDDPRRHTLGGDILVYGNSQHPHAHQLVQQQRAMDLEVSHTFLSLSAYINFDSHFLLDEHSGAKEQEKSTDAGIRTRQSGAAFRR